VDRALASTKRESGLIDVCSIQGTVTPRRRAQEGGAGSGSYPSLLAYMLADIVVAIPAVDLAVEAVV
jgi:hypothetical protein